MNRAARLTATLALVTGLGLAGLGLSGCGVVSDPNGTPVIELPTALPEVTLPTIDVNVNDNSGGGSSDTSGESSSQTQPATPQNHDLWSAVVTVLIVLLALWAVVALLRRARRDRDDDDRRHATQSRQITDLLTVSRWGIDQARQLESAADPAKFASAQPSLASYLSDGEARAARLAGQISDSDLATAVATAGTALSTLRGSMMAYLGVGADRPADEGQVRAQRAALASAREQVETAVHEVIARMGSL